MCGITGIFNFDNNKIVDQQDLLNMNNSLVHRGPDGDGLFIQNNIGLGHRRLKIIDLLTGEQPMFSFNNNIVLVFNGEIYNYQELKKELISKGHKFFTSSDTEVIINSYLEWGLDCQNKFNGMWSFALWDKTKQRLFLSIDRIGQKPLFYSLYNNSFYFGSEIKSLFSAKLPKQINEELTELYLSLSYIPGKNTYFKNIFKVLPGQFLLVDNTGIKEIQYWDLPEIDESNMNKNIGEIKEEFSNLLQDSVKIRMNSDVPFGAFLSGGLDSASVVSLMCQNSDFPIETFTIGFKEAEFDESKLAQMVSDKFSTNHNLGYVDSNSMEFFINLISNGFDEPFGDNSAIPTYQVSNYASKKVKMVLTGDGGDEVMSGYPTYLGLKYFELYNKFPKLMRKFISRTLKNSSELLPKNLSKKVKYFNSLLLSSDMSFNENICSKKPVTQLINIKKVTNNIKNVVKIEDYINDFESKIPYKDNFYKYMYFDIKNRLPYGYLPKVDRMSMANSIETRAPFLDYRLIEFMVNVEKNIKVRNFQTKSILKNTVAKTLPSKLLNSKKMGFITPLDKWLRDPNTNIILKNLKSSEWSLDNNHIEKMINQNNDGSADNGSFLWQLLILKQHQ